MARTRPVAKPAHGSFSALRFRIQRLFAEENFSCTNFDIA
jgi:hypothetical protein